MTDYISRDEALTALETSYREKPFTDAVEIIRSLPAATPELGRAKLEWETDGRTEKSAVGESWFKVCHYEHSDALHFKAENCRGTIESQITREWPKELAERLQFVLDSPSLETPEAKVLLTGPTINWAVEYTKLQSHVMKYISELTGWSINEIPFPGPSLGTRECPKVIEDYLTERQRIEARWPDQHLRDFPELMNFDHATQERDQAQELRNRLGDKATWWHVLREEVYEAFAESDERKLRAELVQVMAVAGGWIEDIDSRGAPLEGK